MKKAIVVVALALMCSLALALAGCAGHGTLGSDIDDAGTYTVKADDAGKGSAVSMLGGITVGEGQLLVVSPNLDKGSLQVRLTNEESTNDEASLDVEASGKTLNTYKLDADEYGIAVICNADGTTGTLVVAVVDEAEFEKQNSDLEAILGTMEG